MHRVFQSIGGAFGYFSEWIANAAPAPYGSFGNGAAMHVAPVALLYRRSSLEDALAASDRVTAITHDHPEGIKGGRCTLCRSSASLATSLVLRAWL